MLDHSQLHFQTITQHPYIYIFVKTFQTLNTNTRNTLYIFFCLSSTTDGGPPPPRRGVGPQNKTHKRRRRDRRAPGRRGNDRSARGCLRRTWRRPLRQARGNKIDITIPLMARARVSPRQRERTLLGRLAQNLSDTSPHHRATFSNVAPSHLALDVTPPCQDNSQGGCTRRTGIIPVTRPGKSGGSALAPQQLARVLIIAVWTKGRQLSHT